MENQSLKCPNCGCFRGRVIDTREIHMPPYHFLKRIRQCGHCGYKYSTKEFTDENLPSRPNQTQEDWYKVPIDERKQAAEKELEAAAEEVKVEKPKHELPNLEPEPEDIPKPKRGRPKKNKSPEIFPPLPEK